MEKSEFFIQKLGKMLEIMEGFQGVALISESIECRDREIAPTEEETSFIVDPVIIYIRFEETGNELPYYERCSGKEEVCNYSRSRNYLYT